jgi:hypothetical protein
MYEKLASIAESRTSQLRTPMNLCQSQCKAEFVLGLVLAMRYMIAIIALVFCAFSASAQHEHHHESPVMKKWYEDRKEMMKPKPKYPVGEIKKLGEERRLSYRGYRHRELHEEGVIDELLEKTGNNGKNCCDDVENGECRESQYIFDEEDGKQKVLVDGLKCEIASYTRVVFLERFTRPGRLVVCADKIRRNINGQRMCPDVFCVGRTGGL